MKGEGDTVIRRVQFLTGQRANVTSSPLIILCFLSSCYRASRLDPQQLFHVPERDFFPFFPGKRGVLKYPVHALGGNPGVDDRRLLESVRMLLIDGFNDAEEHCAQAEAKEHMHQLVVEDADGEVRGLDVH